MFTQIMGTDIKVLFILILISFFSCDGEELVMTTEECYRHQCDFNIEIINAYGEGSSECGAEINPTNNPIGGGHGFINEIDDACISAYVETVEELLVAINTSFEGEVIYLDDNSTFDLTDEPTIEIDRSLVLISGRGRDGSLGALIIDENEELGDTTNHDGKFNVLRISSGEVKISSLRIHGPHPIKINSDFRSIGILVDNGSCVEIENLEIENFSHAAIAYNASKNGFVHHNYIHNCQGRGLGYGVLLVEASEVLVEGNIFERNRHDIAGTGDSGQKYEARYNLDLRNSTENFSRSFDMHGMDERNCISPTNVGGSTVVIHHNSFLDDRDAAIILRGHPELGVWISNNKFPNASIDEAIYEPFCEIERVNTANNCFD